MSIIEKYTIERGVRECRVLVGPMAEKSEVMDALFEEGWRTTFCGPYTNARMFPKVDANRFHIGVERAIPASTGGTNP